MTASDWQLWLVLVIVAGAACYVARSFWKSVSAKKGCGGGCGCKSATSKGQSQTPLISSDSIVLRPARAIVKTKQNQVG